MSTTENILLLTNDDEKTCGRCKRSLPVTSFYRCRRTADTLQNWCIECQRNYAADRKLHAHAEGSWYGRILRIPFETLETEFPALSRREQSEVIAYMKRITKNLERKRR